LDNKMCMILEEPATETQSTQVSTIVLMGHGWEVYIKTPRFDISMKIYTRKCWYGLIADVVQDYFCLSDSLCLKKK